MSDSPPSHDLLLPQPRPQPQPSWTPRRVPWSLTDLLALLAYSLAVCAVFASVIALRKALFYFDITEINYPYRDFLAQEFRAGRFSRWHPGLFCGLPIFSESQAGFLHPLKLLYLLLPAWRAFTLDTVLSVWLAGLGTYLWLRRHVGPLGSLTGASIFGLGGYTFAHWFHTSMINALPSVPLTILALEWAWGGGRRRGIAAGAAAIAIQVFAGHLQDALMTLLLVSLYGLYRAATETTWRSRARALYPPVFLCCLAIALSAVQWIPSKELIDRSPRSGGLSYEEAVYGSWHPQLLPTLLVRDAYGTRARDTDWMDGFYPYHEMNTFVGIIGLALAIAGASAFRDRWVGFWVILAAVGLLLMLGRYNILFDALYRVPILGSGRIPVRYHIWVQLALSALAAIGVDRLARTDLRPPRLKYPAIVLSAILVLSIPILIWTYIPAWTEADRWTLPYHIDRYRWLARESIWATARTISLAAAAVFLFLKASRSEAPSRKAAFAAGIPLLLLVELASAHSFDIPGIVPSYWLDPPQSARFLRSSPDTRRVFGFGVYSAGEPGYASELRSFFKSRDTLAWSLAPVWGIPSSWGATPIISRRVERYATAANLAGVRFDIESVSHVLTGPPAPSQERFGAPVQIGTALIARNERVLPRARLMGRPVYAKDEQDSARLLIRLGQDARDRLVVEDPARPLPEDAPAAGKAEIALDLPERVEVVVEAQTPCYLFLADTFDPGWSATLDSAPTPVLPAQVAFRAVFIPAGRHRVAFSYCPAGFQRGAAISLAGLLLAAACLAFPGGQNGDNPEHGPSTWPSRWPLMLAMAVVFVILASTLTFSESGRPALQGRWSGSFHRFTWGAGIEAMKPG